MTETVWKLARRATKMNPSLIREILKLTDKPGMISFAGGLPSPETFPVREFLAACQTVLESDGMAALQYSVSEGYRPLREQVASWLPWQGRSRPDTDYER
jgi:2-aminoadipate transaminase